MFRRLGKDTLIYGGGDFAGKIVAFAIFPIIAAALSPFAFGALELILTTTTLLGIFMNCGLNNALQRFYWDGDTAEAQRPVLVSSGLAVLMVFGVLALTLGFLALPLILPEVERAGLPVSWIGIVAALVLMVSTHWLQYLLDVTRLHFAPFKYLTLSLISRVFGLLLAMVALVYWGWGLDGMLTMQACVALALFPLALWAVREDITLRFQKDWARELINYGHPYIFAALAFWLFGSMDRWMLASMSSIEETGLYSIAFRFSSIVLFVSAAFGMAWSPLAIKYKTDNPTGYREFYAQVLLLLLFIMIIVGGSIALFSGEVISLIMPDEYAASALPMTVLCFGVVLQATQQVTAIGISIEKKTFILARIAWLSAFINLGLNWLLIPEYGAVGAAWATTISYLVLTGSYLFCTQRLHPLPIPWKKLFWLLFLGVLVAAYAVFSNSSSFTWGGLGLKLLLVGICAVLGWLAVPVKCLSFVKNSISTG